ncbi:RtcB family protein [Hoylesella loescheii]|uniref:RtcB family protein n=1 Tax=Hoylesella loescheii TaxID=840 RepID=UPI0011DC8470
MLLDFNWLLLPSLIGSSNLPVSSAELKKYWVEMQYCIDFALCNRSLMMQRIQEMLTDALPGIAF